MKSEFLCMYVHLLTAREAECVPDFSKGQFFFSEVDLAKAAWANPGHLSNVHLPSVDLSLLASGYEKFPN